MESIKIAIVGVGNCASSLLQGIEYYKIRDNQISPIGLMHWSLGGYLPSDIEVVAAFDIDRRKVGFDIAHAVFSPPNCTKIFHKNIATKGVKVSRVHLTFAMSISA